MARALVEAKSARERTVESWSRWRRTTAAAALWVAVIRVVVGLLVSRAAVSIVPDPHIAPSNGASPHSLVWSFIHWDALLFLRIANHGYDRSFPAASSFFPVYPLLGRLVAKVTPLSNGPSLVVVSWIGLFLATWAVMELARTLWPDSSWYRCGVLFAWFPASVFLMAGYSESVYIALAGWALVYLVKGRWVVSAVFAGIASAARPEGALVGIVLVGYLLWKRRVVHALVALAIAEAGVVVVTLFFAVRYHRMFEQFHAQSLWHRHATWPFHPVFWTLSRIVRGEPLTIPSMESNTVAVLLFDDAMILAAVAAIVWLVRVARRDHRLWPLVAFSMLYVALIVSNGPSGKSPEGAARTLMCVVPLVLFPVAIKSERTWSTVLVASATCAIFGQVLFNVGFWFT